MPNILRPTFAVICEMALVPYVLYLMLWKYRKPVS